MDTAGNVLQTLKCLGLIAAALYMLFFALEPLRAVLAKEVSGFLLEASMMAFAGFFFATGFIAFATLTVPEAGQSCLFTFGMIGITLFSYVRVSRLRHRNRAPNPPLKTQSALPRIGIPCNPPAYPWSPTQ